MDYHHQENKIGEIMDNKQLIMNAIDANGFSGTGQNTTVAGYINPTVWSTQLLQFLEQNLVLTRFAKVYNDLLGQAGSTLKITINSTPAVAAAVAESDDVTVAVYATTQVTFTPSEYAFAYELSDKEARRAFYDVATDMARKIGYALALKRDTVARTALYASPGNTVMVAGKSATTDLASSDTLDFATVVNAATKIRTGYMIPRYFVVSPGQLGQLSKLSQFSYANQAGTTQTLYGGMLGTLYGMEVYWTTQVTPSSSVSKAIMLGVDQFGEPAFGIAMKANPTIRTQRFELGRHTNIVGVEEYDVQVLRAAGVCIVDSYDA
jgi:N4-gp56 family major capsid protein